MYIIKNALRCIGRSKGRNILIGIIALVIAVSACLGLSVRQAAESTKKNTLDGMSISATISYDRSSMMNNIMGGSFAQGFSGMFDRNQFSDIMGNASELTLEEYKKYVSAKSVQDFYFTITVSLNGSGELLPVSDETGDSDSGSGTGFDFSGFGGMNFIGAGIGAVSSVPVTNALLAGQVESQNSQQNKVDEIPQEQRERLFQA